MLLRETFHSNFQLFIPLHVPPHRQHFLTNNHFQSSTRGKEGEPSLIKCFPHSHTHAYFSAYIFILAVGDFVSEDEVIAEIETDKVMGVKIP